MERGAPDSDERLALWKKRNAPRKPAAEKPLPSPMPEDAVPGGLCRRCGLVGEHGGPGECIDALRGLVADLESQGGAKRG